MAVASLSSESPTRVWMLIRGPELGANLENRWVAAENPSAQPFGELRADLMSLPWIGNVLSDEDFESAVRLVERMGMEEIRRLSQADLLAEVEYRTRNLAELRTASKDDALAWVQFVWSESPEQEWVERLDAEIERRRSVHATLRLAPSGITSDFARDLKGRVLLSEFIQAQVAGISLKRAGRIYQARCPFHTENTPSFTVYDDTGRYICFGCWVRGDVFDVCEQLLGIRSWRDAVEHVARYAGISLPKAEPPANVPQQPQQRAQQPVASLSGLGGVPVA